MDCVKGLYIFWLAIPRPCLVRVGSLGTIDFQAGHYAYVGSAMGPGGIFGRLKHHCSISSKPHWHIDYLRNYGVPETAWAIPDTCGGECSLAEVVQNMSRSMLPAAGFGASDCNCSAHLFCFACRPHVDEFLAQARRQNILTETEEIRLYFPDTVICHAKNLQSVSCKPEKKGSVRTLPASRLRK
jgi:Uri superfamily endonuclease